KLPAMWEFGKAANPYTKRKPVPIPLFALHVTLGTRKEANDYGYSWIPTFEIKRDETGFPLLIADPGRFQFIKAMAEKMEELVNQIAENQSVEDEGDPYGYM